MALAFPLSAPAASALVYGTRDQARQCMVEEEQLAARVAQRQHAHELHDESLAKSADESAEIARREASVDSGNQEAVRAFNQLVADHNAHVDKINQEALESLAVVDSYNADAAAHNKRCAGLLIRPEDLAALTRERARSAPQPAASRPVSAAASQSR